MTPDNRVIQGLWVGTSLSVMEQLSIASFLRHGHEYHLYVYDRPTGIPRGTVVKDANEIVDQSRIWRYKQDGFFKGSISGFSELFRYALLHKRGGWWVDCDVVCLRPFTHANPVVISSSQEAEHGIQPCTFVLKFPAGGPFTKYLYEAADRPDPDQIGCLEIGPFLVQRMVKELGLEHHLAPPGEFAPIGWRGLPRIVREPMKLRPREVYRRLFWWWKWTTQRSTDPGHVRPTSYALHLWNEFWRNCGLDKNKIYSKSCEYEQLKGRYLPVEVE